MFSTLIGYGPERVSRSGVIGATCLLGMAVLLQGCSKTTAGPAENKKRERKYLVRTAEVAVRPITYELETTGALQARDIYRVDAQVPGVVEGIAFNEGDEVTAQTVLCRIAPRTYELAAQRAKAAWRKAQEAHVRALADVADTERKSRNALQQAAILNTHAVRDYQRRKVAFDAGAITEEELLTVRDKRDLAAIVLKNAQEATQTEVAVMRAAAQEKDAEARQTEVAWQEAEENLRKSSVVSPVSGRIEQRTATNGLQAAAGTPIAQVIDPELRLRFTLPEEQTARVRKDSRVTFRVMAYPERDVPATIYHIGDLTDTKTRLVTLWANVEAPKDMVLKPGFFSTVKIVTDQRAEAMVIPLTAVMPSERGFVAFVVEDGIAHQRPVKLGLQIGDKDVEVTSGLKAGERLVVEGGTALLPDVQIEEAGGTSEKPAAPAVQDGESKKREERRP